MKLEKGDILQIGKYKILVVGYPNNLTRSIRAKILEDYFDLTDWSITKIYTNYIDNIKYEHPIEIKDEEKDYVLVQSLSAYSDNELSEQDSLKVKKYIITNLSARKTLEEFCSLINILKESF